MTTLNVQPYATVPVDVASSEAVSTEPASNEAEFLMQPAVAAQFVRYLWKQNKRNEAVDSAFSSMNKLPDGDHNELRYLATSLLIQMDEDDRAAATLASRPDSSPRWLYLKALLLFRQHGNTPLSRGAFRFASIQNTVIGRLIGGENYDHAFALELDLLDSGDDHEGDLEYAEDAKSAWQHSTGALEWLTGELMRRREVRTTDKREISQAEAGTKGKRWIDNSQIAYAYRKRGEFREAKRMYRMALKEIESLVGDSGAYWHTFDDLVEVLIESGGSSVDIVDILEKHLSAYSTKHAKDPHTHGCAMVKIANYFDKLKLDERAAQLYNEALVLFEQLLRHGDSEISFFEIVCAAHGLGLSLGAQRRYEEAAFAFRRSLELSEQCQGENHKLQLSAVDHLMRCLHHLGHHSEAVMMRTKIVHITGDADYDPHKSHDLSCPWCIR